LNTLVKKQREALIKEYEVIVGKEGIRRARRDHHSRRKPIQCGLTVHPGNDCAYSCVYCYILDMGFKFQRPKPCKLSPEELALALLYNLNFNPGRDGTYIAIGSIIEPFQPELRSLTIRYIKELAKLGNPIQFSSKSHITSGDAHDISSSCNWISPLITILTLEESKAHLLEPLAPAPVKRLDTISHLARAGLKPFLFLRPILPGVVMAEERENLINEAINHGAKGVVLGNLRVSRRIIEAMKKRKLDVSEIIKRSKLIDDKQRPISVSDLEIEIESEFGSRITMFRRSCCASAYSAGLKQCIHKAPYAEHSRSRQEQEIS
jgi:DNA repair photolyase